MGFAAPLLSGPVLGFQQEAIEAQAKQALAQYEKTVLTAFREVEDALVAELLAVLLQNVLAVDLLQLLADVADLAVLVDLVEHLADLAAKTEEIRDLAKEIRQDQSIVFFDQRKDKDLLKGTQYAELGPEAIAQMREMALVKRLHELFERTKTT